MKIDKKIVLVSFVLLATLATVLFNLETFTGHSSRLSILYSSLNAESKGEGSISVYPTEITAGEKIYITISPGDKCINNEISIYKEGRDRPVMRFKKPAKYQGSYTGAAKYCAEATIVYKTWNSWEEGNYYVEMETLPMKVTGKIESRTTYYMADFKINEPSYYPKLIFSKVGDLISPPQIVFGQRYIFN